jgi:hypothetical protein
MIDDIDRTINALLVRDLPADLVSQVRISFAAPDNHFPPQSVTLPAIDIFLYDIRENLEVRTSERMTSQQTSNTHTSLQKLPVHVSYSYLITAWSGSTSNPDQDEHRLLGAVLQVLLRYRTIPAEVMQGKLANLIPLPKADIIQSDALQGRGDYWQSLGGRPKAFINYMLTVPMYAFQPITNVPLITDAQGSSENMFGSDAEPKRTERHRNQVAIAGSVYNATTNVLLPGASVSITSTAHDFRGYSAMAPDGYFHFVGLQPGSYALTASMSGTPYNTVQQNVVVTADAQGKINMQQVRLNLTPL